MKIVIVSPTLNYGGAERVAAMWANAFTRKGHQVFFVSNIENDNAYYLSDRINLLPFTKGKSGKLIKYIKSVFILRSYYKKFSPDVIIGVMYACSMLAKIAEIGLKIPVINTEHNSFEKPSQHPMSMIDKIAKFYFNYLYDAITVLTKADLNIIRNRFKNIYVLPNPTFLTPLSTLPPKQNIVLAAGRLDAWKVKGFDILIESWGRLMKNEELRMKNPGWRLQIAGTGSEKNLNYLKQLCKENKIENSVDFLGFRKDVEKLYQEASIFVLSSRYEGFGLVLIEAMSQGCSCVACDYNGRQREIIQDDSQGLCCEPDNIEVLAKTLEKMITDGEYRESVRMKAIEQSKYYSIDKTMERWEHLLAEIIKN